MVSAVLQCSVNVENRRKHTDLFTLLDSDFPTTVNQLPQLMATEK